MRPKVSCFRTPGFFTWQDQEWGTHCNDACEFHGNATAQDIIDADDKTIRIWMEIYEQNRNDWDSFMNGYAPGGDQGVYKFICKHCSPIVLNWDLS
ncbi:CbrC family protein [Citrobacter freundii]|uniref:CbrC family protein n=1 Tax=Citrobacter freundii TaxID=546 RepID=UPI0015E90261|nr:CbrC family protein [Citrobacter freundii]QMN58985.1 CbrC family protein [Citrobacter freundii]HBM9260339.1 CbrC family protein [Citrobacter freundii]